MHTTLHLCYRDKIESILQDKLFKPSNLIANTVSDALEGTLEIRDDVLNQLKGIRTGNVTICPEQGVKQEPFLAMLRMDVMTVLLKLIEEDAADFTAEKLQVRDLILRRRSMMPSKT